MMKFFRTHKHLFSILIPVFLGATFIILCGLNLQNSVWFDESYSAYLVRGDFSEIWDLTAVDVHPPLFYFLLKIWSNIFGTTDFAMRFMSVFFGAVAIVFIFQLLKRWFGMKAASLASLFVATCPIFIRYGQEMRMYTLVILIVFAATFILSLAFDETDKFLKKSKSEKLDKKFISRKNPALKYWLIYGALVSLGMWTHYFTILIWLTEFFIVIKHFKGLNKTSIKIILATFGFSILLYLPWLPTAIKQFSSVEQGFWIPSFSMQSYPNFLSETMLYEENGNNLNTWLAVLLITTVIANIILTVRVFRETDKETKKKLKTLVALFLAPILLLTALSLPPLKPLFYNRYILYSAILMYIIVGVVAVVYKPLKKDQNITLEITDDEKNIHKFYGNNFLRIACVVLLATCSVFGIINVEKRESIDYAKEALEMIQISQKYDKENLDSADTDGVVPILAQNERLYYDAVFYSTDEFPVYFLSAWTDFEYGSYEPIRKFAINLVDDTDDFLKKYDKLWYFADAPEKQICVGSPDLPYEDLLDDLPEELNDFRIYNVIGDDRFAVLELVRDEKQL